MTEIVIISGSPSAASRSDRVLGYIGGLLEDKGFIVTHLSVRDIPAEALFTADFSHPSVTGAAASIREAQGVVVGSPVYKAAYSGVLKAFIDLLPQDVLESTPVLPLMTGGSPGHLLALDYALKPLLSTLKGHALKGIYLTDDVIDKNLDIPVLDGDCLSRLEKQTAYFAELIRRQHSRTHA
ncbi:FMN reductase [Bhargavaea ginsengi]|uniref:FMN reductase n=1 Tax=Bhargavaea ginsengi TaxID=426757 RepID=A0A1H7BU85_9BACL|nr:NADPH-dependent FMN reductase [Bhargavaea ginsengi]MCM3087803.1 NADPH-dependent FMN reductase [Bhargavaea ginsengi]SEJ76955.1 FMN reductase [Bhargavaea ginsengi]